MGRIITVYGDRRAAVLVSELARRTGRLGAFVGALPLMTALALIWLENASPDNQACRPRYETRP